MSCTKKAYSHTYANLQRAAIDLSLSENPWGVSPNVANAIINAVENAHRYPCDEETLISLIAKHHEISKDSILLGAGANEILEDYLKVYAINKRIVVPSATFPESVACMSTLKGAVSRVPLKYNLELDLEGLLTAVDSNTTLIHICNPNNPTGIWSKVSEILKLAKRSPVPILISEAGADFVGETMINRSLPENVIIVRSFSKSYGIAGLRIGYSVASPDVIAHMKSNLRSYRMSSLAIAAATAAIQDQEHLSDSIAHIMHEKQWLMRKMGDLDFDVIPSHGQNFIAKVPARYGTADRFCSEALTYGVSVVNCSLYEGLNQYVRISPQKREVNVRFIEILNTILNQN